MEPGRAIQDSQLVFVLNPSRWLCTPGPQRPPFCAAASGETHPGGGGGVDWVPEGRGGVRGGVL